MTENLKPCPFCGNEARARAQHWDDGSHVWWVECAACGAEGMRCDDGQHALDAWNTRVQIPGEVCEIEGIGETGPLSLIEERTCEAKLCCDGFYRCTECGQVMLPFNNYCSNCGAKVMRHG